MGAGERLAAPACGLCRYFQCFWRLPNGETRVDPPTAGAKPAPQGYSSDWCGEYTGRADP